MAARLSGAPTRPADGGMMANESLRRLRHERRWTQAQVAELVCAQIETATGRNPGLEANWISRLERGAITWPSGGVQGGLVCGLSGIRRGRAGLVPEGARPAKGRAFRTRAHRRCARVLRRHGAFLPACPIRCGDQRQRSCAGTVRR
ncbi:helix-turn-helix domain-containing protein [Streptomyces uncialis]|uniref:helix-turn-helix domain-containing protein n=1 Tax=Streptomyces uncialis TaxID=1048205 RepID=UPI0033CD6B8D